MAGQASRRVRRQAVQGVAIPGIGPRDLTRCRFRSGGAELPNGAALVNSLAVAYRSSPYCEPFKGTLDICEVGVATPRWEGTLIAVRLEWTTPARGDDTKRRGQTGSSQRKSMSKPVPVRWYRRNLCGCTSPLHHGPSEVIFYLVCGIKPLPFRGGSFSSRNDQPA